MHTWYRGISANPLVLSADTQPRMQSELNALKTVNDLLQRLARREVQRSWLPTSSSKVKNSTHASKRSRFVRCVDESKEGSCSLIIHVTALLRLQRAACQRAKSPPFDHSNTQGRAGRCCSPGGSLAPTWPRRSPNTPTVLTIQRLQSSIVVSPDTPH